MKEARFHRLKIDYELSEALNNAIDDLLGELNESDGMSEDCYRTEIDCWIKDYRRHLTEDQYAELRNYYVLGGIYKVYGKSEYLIKRKEE